ncbi:MAG: diacylglycerol kinase [Candidatus Saccharibacteria bacterium]|nr:diacylglycerol kinase [Candidatus Saccharibacteria bacterium]
MIAAIVARSKNNVIGVNNDLPWDLPDDRTYFRDVTRGFPVVMGRKTAESINKRLGHGLPKRENILVTRDKDYHLEGFTVVHSINEALEMAGPDAFIIGGEQIYTQALPFCQKLFITEVDTYVDGDAYFPAVDVNQWTVVSETPHTVDAHHSHAFTFTVLERKSPA